jgi:hypothetical protein
LEYLKGECKEKKMKKYKKRITKKTYEQTIEFDEMFRLAVKEFNKNMRETRKIISKSIRKTNGII